MKYGLTVMLTLLVMTSCSTRQVREDFAGVTGQRLTSHSINEIMDQLPDEDFATLAGEPVFLECFFLNEIGPLVYAHNRLKMALMAKYGCRLVDDPVQATFRLTAFFTALGTDFDKFGITTPDIVLPVMGGVLSIDVIALEMYHGVAEFYYYIQDAAGKVVVKGDMLKQVVRDDTLVLPLITVPINNLD